MTEFGPHVRWPDPRAYDLIEGYRWGDFQRALLLGMKSWDTTKMTTYQNRAHDTLRACLEERGFRIVHQGGGVMEISADIPAYDSNMEAMLDAWGLHMEGIRILALRGPIEYVGEHKVPIFEASTFGAIGVKGDRKCGIQHGVYVVGRIDVKSLAENPALEPYHSSRVRSTLRRARNTAQMVDAAIPAWDAHVTERAREAEERRLAEERARWEAEPVDEDLAAFTL